MKNEHVLKRRPPDGHGIDLVSHGGRESRDHGFLSEMPLGPETFEGDMAKQIGARSFRTVPFQPLV